MSKVKHTWKVVKFLGFGVATEQPVPQNTIFSGHIRGIRDDDKIFYANISIILPDDAHVRDSFEVIGKNIRERMDVLNSFLEAE